MITPGQLQTKNTEIFRALCERRYEPMLLNIISWLAETHGVMITEAYREKRHMNDLHGTQPVRAIDCRSWDYPTGMDAEIERELNTRWQYDPGRPGMKVCVWHDSGQGEHYHIQTCIQTREKKRKI